MKFLNSVMFVMTMMSFATNYGMLMSSSITTDVATATNETDHIQAYISYGQQSYTTGGAVFTYSAPFTANPTLGITVEDPSPSSSSIYTAEATGNSTSSVTIMVYENSSGTLTEAGTGSVNVHVIAIGN